MSEQLQGSTTELNIKKTAQMGFFAEDNAFSNHEGQAGAAILSQLDNYKDIIAHALAPAVGTAQSSGVWGIGIVSLCQRNIIETFKLNGNQPFKISVVGMLKIDDDVDANLFKNSVTRVSVHGKLVAPPEIVREISGMAT